MYRLKSQIALQNELNIIFARIRVLQNILIHIEHASQLAKHSVHSVVSLSIIYQSYAVAVKLHKTSNVCKIRQSANISVMGMPELSILALEFGLQRL